MKSIEVAFPAFVVTLVAALLAIGWFGYHYPMSVLGYPLVLGLIVIVTGVSVCTIELAKPAAANADAEAPDALQPQPQPQPRRIAHEADAGSLRGVSVWVHLGCPMLLMAAGWALGFIPAIVLFVFGYLRIAGWSWRGSALYGLAAGLVVWLLFDRLFFTPLPFWPTFMR